jgi:hypothetical protein
MSFKLNGYVTVSDRLARSPLSGTPNLRVTESQPRIGEIGNATFIEVAVTVFRGPELYTLPVTVHAWRADTRQDPVHVVTAR